MNVITFLIADPEAAVLREPREAGFNDPAFNHNLTPYFALSAKRSRPAQR